MPRKTQSEALAYLMALCQYSSAPALTATEVDDILDRHVIAVPAVTSTVYLPGERIVPATPNGYMYQVFPFPDGWTAVGTGFTAPDTYPTMLINRYGGLTDGIVQAGALAIGCIGYEPLWLWDLDCAANEAWMVKAGKAASGGVVKAGRLSIDNSGLRAECEAQAKRFRPKGFV